VATKEVERATIAFSKEPQTVEEALNGKDAKKWETAMEEEYNFLIVNNTWSLVPLPKGRKPISCKWVFKIKHGVHGEVERYKVRHVARGFTQTFGVDYNETFAPVAKFMSICCILALVAMEDMEIHQMEVKTAFFNGDLEEEIYMEQPEGFTQEGEHLVCKFHKSLYRLKQSPRAWNQKLDAFLKNIEFLRSDADLSLYVAQVGDVKFFIVVYVDDLILVCNNKDKLLQVKQELFRKFKMKDLSDLHFFFGMEVERDCAQLTHSQLLARLKSESKYKTTEGGGVGACPLAHNTLRGRRACWNSGMGLGRVDKLHLLTQACTQPTQGG